MTNIIEIDIGKLDNYENYKVLARYEDIITVSMYSKSGSGLLYLNIEFKDGDTRVCDTDHKRIQNIYNSIKTQMEG